jgi:phage-related holin
MWYLIAYLAGFLTFFAIVEFVTGIVTDWAVRKIDKWWIKVKRKLKMK